MKVKELKKSIKTTVEPVYFVTGDDRYLKEFVLKTFISLLNPDVVDFNLNTFQDFTELSDIITALRSYPLMDNRKVVVVKEATSLTKEQEAMLISYLERPELQSVLLIFDTNNLKKLYNRGEIIDCSSLSMEECVSQIDMIARSQNRNILPQASRKLAEYCLCDLQKIHTELEKLLNYRATGNITVEDVDSVVTPSTDYKIYEFTQSLADKDSVRAKKIMDNLLFTGNKPLNLIQSILSQYKRMLYSLISSGTDEEIAKSLNIKPYAVKMSRRTAEHYSPKILKTYCDNLVDLEYKSLTGQINKDDALKTAISMLIAK